MFEDDSALSEIGDVPTACPAMREAVAGVVTLGFDAAALIRGEASGYDLLDDIECIWHRLSFAVTSRRAGVVYILSLSLVALVVESVFVN